MKRFYFTMMALAAVAFVSCVQQEQPFDDVKFGENDLVFTIGGPATKAGSFKPEIKQGVSIPMGNDGQGNALFLEETIEELNPAPATKGTPAYTINVGTLYPTMGVIAFGDPVAKNYQVMDMYEHDGSPNDGINEDGWRYTYSYSGSPWPDESTKVDFYFNMPAAPTGLTFTSRANKKIEFSYTSPTSGKAQEDILFSQASYSKSDHDGYLPYGAPVLMYHALTGVKFRNGHENGNQTKTIITGVKLTGLKNSGSCVVNLAADNVITWTPGTTTGAFTQSFDNPDYVVADGKNNPDGTIGSTDWNSDLIGTSWTSAAADKNLNDKDGSLTFWFIPQEISDGVKLEVTFVIKTPDTPEGSGEYTHTIDFGALLNADRDSNVEWKAGQLRTYTLKPFDVDVAIEDEITATKKSDLHIANTGNVEEYVRMLIMGNWYGWETEADYNAYLNGDANAKEPSILVGYKYQDPTSAAAISEGDPMMLPWFREGYDLDNNPNTPNVDPYGTFDSSFLLAKLGTRDGNRDDWADASGGFYYTMPIGPGEGVNSEESATKDLFESYTVTNVPTIYIATNGVHRTPAYGVHLIMEIVVQAIAVPKNEDGTDKWWLQAWYEATGIDKLDPEADRNAAYKAKYEAHAYDPE